VDPGHRLGQLVRVSQYPSPRAGTPFNVGEGDVADDRGVDQLPSGRPQLGGCGQIAVLAGVDPQHPAPGWFPGSYLYGLEPGNDTPRPGIHDADHAGGFGGHRALAAAAARSGWNLLADVLGRPEGHRSLAHRSSGEAPRAGQTILMTGLALDRHVIVPFLPPRLGGNHTECLVLVNLSEYRRTGHGPPACRPL
jgi:hypothetical protein